MIKASSLSVLLFGLLACQPKGAYLYQYPNAENHEINQVMLVIDYLNLKDDVGKYWDFDSHYHQKVLNQLLHKINSQLSKAGYPQVNTYLLSSGLLFKTDFSVEHYIQDQLQNELMYPPFILAKQNITEVQIPQHQEILGTFVKYIAPRRHHNSDELSHRGMQLGYQLESMDVADGTAIMYVQIDLSAPGIIKQLGAFLLSGAIASQADYAHIHLDATTKRHASAFLIHKGSGQILWKNHTTRWTPEQPIDELLKGLPPH